MLKNFYPTNLILHRFFDIVVNGLMKDRHVSPSRGAELSAIDPFLKCRPLALVLLPDLEEDASGELGGAVDLNNHHLGSGSGSGAARQGLHLYPLRGPRSETSRLEFACEGDVIVIETYKVGRGHRPTWAQSDLTVLDKLGGWHDVGICPTLPPQF